MTMKKDTTSTFIVASVTTFAQLPQESSDGSKESRQGGTTKVNL